MLKQRLAHPLLRALMPGRAFGAWRGLEKLLNPWMKTWAMLPAFGRRRHISGNYA